MPGLFLQVSLSDTDKNSDKKIENRLSTEKKMLLTNPFAERKVQGFIL